jgi:hypothetical protein
VRQSTNHSPTLGQEQEALLLEAQRRLGVRDGMNPAKRPSIFSTRLPLSGNAALSATALIQAVLGIEFTLSGLNKLADG